MFLLSSGIWKRLILNSNRFDIDNMLHSTEKADGRRRVVCINKPRHTKLSQCVLSKCLTHMNTLTFDKHNNRVL